MSKGLYVVGIEGEVIEVADFLQTSMNEYRAWHDDSEKGIRTVPELTLSKPSTTSGCLFARCFSTNAVALKSFPHSLQRYLPSSSCLIDGSTALLKALCKVTQIG